MGFQIAYHTDIGLKKKTNQDALLMKTAQSPEGKIGLFVVCDGMGGLSHGELASASVISGMSNWFEAVLPELLASADWKTEIESRLKDTVQTLNDQIFAYGERENTQLGTTLTAFLVIGLNSYLVQIGDSRAYHIDQSVLQLTKDQTLVAREIERGNLTEEQAKKDPRRNVLLQCVGAVKEIDVVITSGEAAAGAYLLCTDGFYHQISEEELLSALHPSRLMDEKQMTEKLVQLVEAVKERKETDNISAILVKVE